MKTTFSISTLLVYLGLALLTLTGCHGGIVGNGKVETRDEKVGSFTRLVIDGNFHVFIEPSSKPYLRMELDENLYDIVKVTEEGDLLRIESRLDILQAREKSLYIGIDKLEKIELKGGIKLIADKPLKLESLKAMVIGAARLDFEIEAQSLDIDISGASECDIKGKVDDFDVHMAGAGDIDALDLIAKNVSVDLSGAGGARIFASEKLDVSISGVGSVRYRGEPQVQKRISGLGSLKRD